MNKKRKLISKTYLRDVEHYNLNIYFDNEDYYIAIKKIISMKEPFILPTNLCLMDNNYYIAEIIPKNENYTVRIFLNEKKEKLLYYFDITAKNGLDEETKIPFYDDLYLDVVIEENEISVLDEDELLDALNNKMISKDDFDFAVKTKDLLIESIKSKNNKYLNLNLEKYLN